MQQRSARSRAARFSVAGLVAAGALLVTAPVASAKDGDTIARGACSAASTWKLKASDENNMIEVDFEVDQNVNNQRWLVTISHNGEVAFTGRARTRPPSGSFTVRTLVPNAAGADAISAQATNRQTGETCSASLSH
jgi:hypothetical protein